MISFYTLFVILFIHWLFDFVLQSDAMAKGKSSSNLSLFEHIAVYTGGLLIIIAMTCLTFNHQTMAVVWIAFNAVAHFITDWVTSRASSALYKEGKTHDFFVCVGIDQFIHYITLIGTFIYFSKL